MGGILSQCIVLGKGFDGARDQLMRILFWAGAAHNEFLELMLSGGVIATTAFLFGWFIVIRRGLRPGIMKATLPLHTFVFLVSFTGQSLTMFRAFGTLLLVCLQYWTLEGVHSHDH
jgi:O-antigen ligase